MTDQPSPFAPLTVLVSGVSDKGHHRPDNQDTIGWTEIRVGTASRVWQLAVLADGAGGHAGGAAASRRAVQRVLTRAAKVSEPPDAAWLRALLEDANAAVHDLAMEMHEAGNMGTTIVALLCSEREAVAAHVGDSRLYLVRHQVCRQVTSDHSFVWWLMAQGEIGQDETHTHPRHGVITRCLGVRSTVEVELLHPALPLKAGDRFVLCSDGLTEVLTDQDIAVVLGDQPTEVAAQALVDLANARDTRDNVSAIVVAVDATGAHS
jgi:protein phosphatase